MVLFCPHCSNRLYPSLPPSPIHATALTTNSFACRTCPYQFPLTHTYVDRANFSKRKEVEDVMGTGKEAWKNVDKTDVQCPKEGCAGGEAFFYQVQIRSADEPMSVFYKCTTCGQRWKEN